MKVMDKPIYILAIETSCDETAAAVLEMKATPPNPPSARGGTGPQIKTLSSVVKSQISIHKSFGGVVPEAAARAHVKNILPVVKKALAEAKITSPNLSLKKERNGPISLLAKEELREVNYIAITVGPGLIPSLIVGVEFVRALGLATEKPIIPVNHMMGHLYSPFGRLNAKRYALNANLFPMISLIVSGGHTILTVMKNIRDYKVLGQTVDDAAGEAFDKVAKLLRLPYPGGPEVGRLAMRSKNPVNFPRPMINSKNYNFSFSGLKTAVLYYVQSLQPTNYNLQAKQNICAGFQNAAVDVLVTKTLRAVKEYGAKSISLSGGVAANKSLRQMLKVKCQMLGLKFFAPPQNLCTDNAEMIGLAACFMLHNGFKPKNYKTIKADPNLSL
jgi:N6-L-threonylcarbamoyladenine synthase